MKHKKEQTGNDAVDQVRGENVTLSFALAQNCNEVADLLEKKMRDMLNIKEIEIFEELSNTYRKLEQSDIDILQT